MFCGLEWTELVEDEGCFSDFVQMHFSVDFQSLVIRTFFSSWYRKDTCTLMGSFRGFFG